MEFTYSISHIDFSLIASEKELIQYLEEHDKDSFLFSFNTGQINMAIGKESGKKADELYLMFQCGVFHDVGKLGMSKEFINYPGAFTVQMYKEMKKHPKGGATILERVNAQKELIETAKYHHCNFDGSGYPGGFYYTEIPYYARVTRVSDSIDAYMSKRCYKEGGPTNEIVKDLEQYKGTSYDPDILGAFMKVHSKVMAMCHREGIDHPPQNIYMHCIDLIYGTREKELFLTHE